MRLSSTTIVFLDANVVMYAAGSEHLCTALLHKTYYKQLLAAN